MSRASSFERATLDPFYHELRTSLTLIQTCTDLLMHADQIGQADLRNFLQIIRRGGTRIDRLVRDYILLAKGEYGVLSEEKVAQPTSVLPPLNLALLEVRAESNDRGVEVVSDLPETMPSGFGQSRPFTLNYRAFAQRGLALRAQRWRCGGGANAHNAR